MCRTSVRDAYASFAEGVDSSKRSTLVGLATQRCADATSSSPVHLPSASAGADGRRYACAMAKHPEGSEPFDVTMPEGFELGARRTEFEAAAKQAGWTVEHDGATIVVRDVWTDNEDHAAWLVATKAGLPLEKVTVWAGRAD